MYREAGRCIRSWSFVSRVAATGWLTVSSGSAMLGAVAARTIDDEELHAHCASLVCCRRRRLMDHDGAKRIVLDGRKRLGQRWVRWGGA
jgi:hypothetical protein